MSNEEAKKGPVITIYLNNVAIQTIVDDWDGKGGLTIHVKG